MSAWFYILRLVSGRFYAGSTRDRDKRVEAHFNGTGSRTTKLNHPVAVAHEEEFATYREAPRRERQVKKWSHAKKVALIRGDLAELKRPAVRRVYERKQKK